MDLLNVEGLMPKDPKKSFLTCPHNDVQQLTIHCTDCGHNIYMTKKEYLKEPKKEDNKIEIHKL